ncbi:5'-methylthioadenosine/adenosylhomocysteine nucleosidase [Arundinibacter roseus]|uniref:adenosylhomocysteine nucleosidase n=1 Tax=Arundinibacter roseus TaxID=2070510 RepID=A0A4R4KBI4_9BACT|nr:5'-methylthioadenosine/adenosylhomocysteine nucleosidase [Arundinibacter roseus]TDB65128.1 5'-methylthioadenosine/adenosylhomocysteine nucleosidase [Arundinibacter roseus]
MKKFSLLFLILTSIFTLTISFSHAQIYKKKNVTALLGAFSDEVKLLEQSVSHKRVRVVHGIPFTTGKLNGRKVVIALTGIGKANAAMTTTLMLQTFRPAQVLFTGIAGGLNPALLPGDIVIGKEVTYHDFGYITFQKQATRQTRNPITNEFNPADFPADSLLLSLAQQAVDRVTFESSDKARRAPKVIQGRIVTGDVFVSSEEKVQQLIADFGADATEMEGATVAQICWQQQVPCLVIRSLSDKANGSAREDMLQFLKIAAQNSAALVKETVRSIR